MYCILLVDLRQYLPEPMTARDAAEALYSLGLFPGTTPDEIESFIADMMNWGHRYLNLEKDLGKGISMMLETELSETMYLFVQLNRRMPADSFI